MQQQHTEDPVNSATAWRRYDRDRKRAVWCSPCVLAVLRSPVILQTSTPLSCEKTGDTTLSSLVLEVQGKNEVVFGRAQRSYSVSLPVSANRAILRASSTDPGAQVGYQLSAAGVVIEGAWLGVGSANVGFDLPVGRSLLAVMVKASGGSSDNYLLNITVGCNDCNDGNDCTSDTCDVSAQKCVHSWRPAVARDVAPLGSSGQTPFSLARGHMVSMSSRPNARSTTW